MKHLMGLWDTVAAYTTPVRGATVEGLEAMFRSCDALIVAKIDRASMITLEGVADVLHSSFERLMHQLVIKISAMEPEDQTATAERARRMVTTIAERALNDAMDNFAERSGVARNKTRH